MGQQTYKRIAILMCCFITVGIVIHGQQSSGPAHKEIALRHALMELNKWGKGDYLPLDEEIIKSLKLDDYANHRFVNGSESVFLYIGYYLTSKKIGAAHDPLVCYPGQGWQISNRANGSFKIKPEGDYSISYSSMIAETGLKRELILYWFQAFDQTNPDTFSQKLSLLWSKIVNHREDNAFIRISIPVEKKTEAYGLEIIHNFIRDFYPVFLDYVKDGSPVLSQDCQTLK